MSKNNGNGKTLTTELVRDLYLKITEMVEKQAEVIGRVDQVCSLVENHLQEHKEKPEKFIYPLLGKIGRKKWLSIFIAFFLFQTVLAVLIFKFGIEKFIGIFK